MLIRICVFLSLVTLSIISMLGGDVVELRIVSAYGSTWFFAQVFYRLLIFTMLYIALVILAGGKNKLILTTLVIIISLAIGDTVNYTFFNSSQAGLFLKETNRVISLGLFTFLFIATLLFFKKEKSRKIKKWLYFLFIPIVLGISFVKIIYRDDWIIKATDNQLITIEQAIGLVGSSNTVGENLLMPFLSTSCSFCRLAATKIGISNKKNSLPPTCLVFSDPKKKVEQFIKETDVKEIKYIIIPTDTFYNYAGFQMPSIFYIDKSGSSQWVGEQFNNLVLDDLASKKRTSN